MRRIRRRKPEDDYVTASEIASYAYCPEQWRLEYGLGISPENRPAMDAGATSPAEGCGGAGRGRFDHAGAVSGRSGGHSAPTAALVVVMNVPAGWIALGAFLALLLGLWLMLAGRGMRQCRGLGSGKTVSLDRVTLTSHRLGLTGRPDRLIKADGSIIVEEWKSSSQCTSYRGLGGRTRVTDHSKSSRASVTLPDFNSG